MADMEKVIKGLEEAKIRLTQAVDRGGSMSVIGAFNCLNRVTDTLELLKEQEYARCRNCQFRDFGENEVDAWDMCRLHRHNTSADEYCSWFVEKEGEME